MKVTEKDVAHVAALASLDLSSEERARMVRDLNSILEYVDRLNQVDTSDVTAMAQAATNVPKESVDPFAYASRDDILHGLRPSLPHNVAVGSAPNSDGVFFKVPKVIER